MLSGEEAKGETQPQGTLLGLFEHRLSGILGADLLISMDAKLQEGSMQGADVLENFRPPSIVPLH